jgi:hypothetical protein
MCVSLRSSHFAPCLMDREGLGASRRQREVASGSATRHRSPDQSSLSLNRGKVTPLSGVRRRRRFVHAHPMLSHAMFAEVAKHLVRSSVSC